MKRCCRFWYIYLFSFSTFDNVTYLFRCWQYTVYSVFEMRPHVCLGTDYWRLSYLCIQDSLQVLHSSINVIDKDEEETGPSTKPWTTPEVMSPRLMPFHWSQPSAFFPLVILKSMPGLFSLCTTPHISSGASLLGPWQRLCWSPGTPRPWRTPCQSEDGILPSNSS